MRIKIWYLDFQNNSHTVRVTNWYQLSLEFRLTHTWIFAHWRHQRIVTRLENVQQLKKRWGRKLYINFLHRQPLRYLILLKVILYFFIKMKNARYLVLSYFRRYWFTLSKLTWKKFWTEFCMQNFRLKYFHMIFFSYYNQQEFSVHIHLSQLQCIVMQT